MTTKRCSVHFKDSGAYIVGEGDEAKYGWTVVCGPVRALSLDASCDDLGRAVRQALDGFQTGVSDYESSWRRVVTDLWAAGVRDWSSLAASSQVVVPF
jgi:hypothetical protein